MSAEKSFIKYSHDVGNRAEKTDMNSVETIEIIGSCMERGVVVDYFPTPRFGFISSTEQSESRVFFHLADYRSVRYHNGKIFTEPSSNKNPIITKGIPILFKVTEGEEGPKTEFWVFEFAYKREKDKTLKRNQRRRSKSN